MSQGLRNAGVVYGTRGEIFDASKGQSLEEFIHSTFDIQDVFEHKLVMGRCICHGKKDLETDVLLSSQEVAGKFLFSKESTKPHIILIYDKPGTLESKPETQSDILVSAQQWEELVDSVKKLQMSGGAQNTTPKQGPVHKSVVCDACYPDDDFYAKEIVGPRFKCLDCPDFDLCSLCEAKGVEKGAHRRSHNMAKINTPLKKCFGSHYDTCGLNSNLRNPEQTFVADVPPEHHEDVFKMFSSIDKLRDVIRGYQAYCSSQEPKQEPLRTPNPGRERRKRESSLLEITATRRDNLLMFSIYNSGKQKLPGGSTLKLSFLDDKKQDTFQKVKGDLGPHELLPGGRKIFNLQISSSFPQDWTHNESRISLLDGQNKDHILYTGKAAILSGNVFHLRPPVFANATLPDGKPVLPLEKVNEEEEIDSSSMTNDEYSLCSESGSESIESNWEDYDFLSEDDV